MENNFKFKVGDKVKWNDGKYHNDDKRIDVITSRVKAFFGGNVYFTKEVNNKPGEKPKIGKAEEGYLVSA